MNWGWHHFFEVFTRSMVTVVNLEPQVSHGAWTMDDLRRLQSVALSCTCHRPHSLQLCSLDQVKHYPNVPSHYNKQYQISQGLSQDVRLQPTMEYHTAHQHISRLEGFQSMQALHSTHRHMHKYTDTYSRHTRTTARTHDTQCTAVGPVVMYCSYISEYHYGPNMSHSQIHTDILYKHKRKVHTIANI